MPLIKHFGAFSLIVWPGDAGTWPKQATHQAFSGVFAYHPARVSRGPGPSKPLIKRFGAFLLIVWLDQATHQAFWGVFAYRLARGRGDLAKASHASSVSGHFRLSAGPGKRGPSPSKPLIKHFRPFLLIAWLGHATHQAFSAVFAYRLARVSHSSSVFGRFCLSAGPGTRGPGPSKPLIKRFGPFLLIVWLGGTTHQAFSGVFAYRLARSNHASSVFGRFCSSPGSGEPGGTTAG